MESDTIVNSTKENQQEIKKIKELPDDREPTVEAILPNLLMETTVEEQQKASTTFIKKVELTLEKPRQNGDAAAGSTAVVLITIAGQEFSAGNWKNGVFLTVLAIGIAIFKNQLPKGTLANSIEKSSNSIIIQNLDAAAGFFGMSLFFVSGWQYAVESYKISGGAFVVALFLILAKSRLPEGGLMKFLRKPVGVPDYVSKTFKRLR
jgi:hypothetical protein